MKKVLVLLWAALLVGFTSFAQAPEPNQRLVALIKDVEIQQAQITDNQGKIESKLATIGEAIRVSRIWSSRSN
jgi:hypothetical protein